MPHHEVKCPCGKTKMIYRSPKQKVPKYCSMACRRRFHSGNYKRKKWLFTPEMDEQIRELYRNKVSMKSVAYTGPVKKLAEKFGMPRWKVSKRAGELDVVPVQKKEPIYSDTEIWILNQCAHRSPQVVQKYLKRAGYRRSQQGIKLKMKRLQLSRATMNGYTSRSLAGLFGVDDHGIARWIKKGWLTAQKRGTARTPQQGGDEWFIRPEWVREFVIANVAVIDFMKVDKYWMVEVLTEAHSSQLIADSKRKTERPEIEEPDEVDIRYYDDEEDEVDIVDGIPSLSVARSWAE